METTSIRLPPALIQAIERAGLPRGQAVRHAGPRRALLPRGGPAGRGKIAVNEALRPAQSYLVFIIVGRLLALVARNVFWLAIRALERPEKERRESRILLGR